MRQFIDIFENHDDPGYDQALALMRKYGSKPMKYSQLPPGAKKSIHQWMVVDGENDEYETNCLYSYGEIPTEEFMQNYFEGILRFDPDLKKDYVDAQTMIARYQSRHPKDSRGFAGYDYSNHSLKEPWPVIIGSEFFEDGAHRLGLYVYFKMPKIPAVMVFDVDEEF